MVVNMPLCSWTQKQPNYSLPLLVPSHHRSAYRREGTFCHYAQTTTVLQCVTVPPRRHHRPPSCSDRGLLPIQTLLID